MKSDTVTNVDQPFSILSQRNQLNILSWICLFSHILLPTSISEYHAKQLNKQRCNIFLQLVLCIDPILFIITLFSLSWVTVCRQQIKSVIVWSLDPNWANHKQTDEKIVFLKLRNLSDEIGRNPRCQRQCHDKLEEQRVYLDFLQNWKYR